MGDTTYIALLRGINVSGQKLIKMERLREIFETMGVGKVRTYIQSGNVVFEAGQQSEPVRVMIESALKEALGYRVETVVRTHAELEDVIARNPFGQEDDAEEAKVYVSFLAEAPSAAAVDVLSGFRSEVDEYRVSGREVYIRCRGQYGKSLFSNNFLEKKLRVTATTRNWQTVGKLAAMARED
ncbi:DUF1697 domain-containing protein [Paenibacillus hodogayensis]